MKCLKVNSFVKLFKKDSVVFACVITKLLDNEFYSEIIKRTLNQCLIQTLFDYKDYSILDCVLNIGIPCNKCDLINTKTVYLFPLKLTSGGVKLLNRVYMLCPPINLDRKFGKLFIGSLKFLNYERHLRVRKDFNISESNKIRIWNATRVESESDDEYICDNIINMDLNLLDQSEASMICVKDNQYTCWPGDFHLKVWIENDVDYEKFLRSTRLWNLWWIKNDVYYKSYNFTSDEKI